MKYHEQLPLLPIARGGRPREIGAVMDAPGCMLAVVFLINHPAARDAQAAQDELLE